MKKDSDIKSEYPKHKVDELGRVIYSQWGENDRTIKKYWEKSNAIKVIYKIYGGDVSFDCYDVNGNNIITYSFGDFEIDFGNFKLLRNGDIKMIVDRKILNKWKKF